MTTTATALADVPGRRKGRGDRRPSPESILSGARAVVFFGGRVDLPWLRLKPDFRHCFICVRWRDGWILIDPLSHVLEVGLIDGMAVDELQAFYENAGYVGVANTVGGDGVGSVSLAPLHLAWRSSSVSLASRHGGL